jgi:hypothetical protein
MKVKVAGMVNIDQIPPQRHMGSHRPSQSMWHAVLARLDQISPNQAVVVWHDACNSSEFHARMHVATLDRYDRFRGRLVVHVRGDRAYIYLKEQKLKKNSPSEATSHDTR